VDTTFFHATEKNYKLRKELGVNDDDFLIIFVGSFIKRKGCGILAEAINIIDDPHIKVIFVGNTLPGDEDDPICKGIVYKGKIAHDQLPAYYSCADVFVLPTQKEGCSNAIVEALAMGLPVISSKGAFNDDILNEENSIRVDATNVQELKEAIITLQGDLPKREKMKLSALKVSRNNTINIRAQRILGFIIQKTNDQK
jgi:glycosyltransferase involved in cell wall biosynthesis